MPDDGAALAKLLVYTPAVVMGLYMIFGLVKLYRNSRAPEKTMSATVLEKRIGRVKPMSNKVYFPRKPDYNHYVSFQMEDGRIVEMPVPEDVYDRLTEGNKGFLTYHGMRYVNFT